MAWRIDEHLIRGEIDNRTPGRITGRLWFLGRAEPVALELEGNPWRDVAGHRLRFTNPAPKPPEPAELLAGFATEQCGVVGDITASRKVKVPDCSMEEWIAFIEAEVPFPWRWGNSLYLEWHSERNGRVVIESANYQLEIDSEPMWSMSEADEKTQREANGRARIAFMERLTGEIDLSEVHIEDLSTDDGVDSAFGPTGVEAEGDDFFSDNEEQVAEEDEHMDLLLNRVLARMARAIEAGETPDYPRIWAEESKRLQSELDEAEGSAGPFLLTEGIREESDAGACDEKQWAADAESGARENARQEHPLILRCLALQARWRADCAGHGWLREADEREHPLRDLTLGVMMAGSKLTDALSCHGKLDTWPPPLILAGGVLVFLKKAHGHLRDAWAGAEAAAEQGLADATWLAVARAEVVKLIAEVQSLMAEVRAVLEAADEDSG